MSEPTRWGPPGFDVASGPTVPIPKAPPPTAAPPPAPYPTARYETPPRPPVLPPAPRDEYGDDDRDHYPDDYRADYRDGPRAGYPSRRPRTRGQLLSGVVLVFALMVSALLGVLTYQALASVDLVSADPFGAVAGWATAFGAVALGALGVFVLALIAFVIARPKALAGLGLAASVLLPVGAVFLGLLLGGDVLRQNVQSDLATVGSDTARAIVEELERNVPDIGPLRDLIVWVAGQGG